MIGVAQGMYWHHRRIWISHKDNEIWLAAHTNKGWFGMKNEVDEIAEKAGLDKPIDKVEKENTEE